MLKHCTKLALLLLFHFLKVSFYQHSLPLSYQRIKTKRKRNSGCPTLPFASVPSFTMRVWLIMRINMSKKKCDRTPWSFLLLRTPLPSFCFRSKFWLEWKEWPLGLLAAPPSTHLWWVLQDPVLQSLKDGECKWVTSRGCGHHQDLLFSYHLRYPIRLHLHKLVRISRQWQQSLWTPCDHPDHTSMELALLMSDTLHSIAEREDTGDCTTFGTLFDQTTWSLSPGPGLLPHSPLSSHSVAPFLVSQR